MDILYISHCVPNPPDKGEKIRAHHVLKALARDYRVHLAAFAWNQADVEAAQQLNSYCASVHVERLSAKLQLAKAGTRFAAGQCLTTSYFCSKSMHEHLAQKSKDASAAVVFTAAMAQYVPGHLPMLLDMTDVDSEKWLQYSRMRIGGFLYGMEARRLRTVETQVATQAGCTFVATDSERLLLQSFAPGARTATVENGVDFEFFNPNRVSPLATLANRKLIVFVGMMDYYPNVDGVCWFASNVMPIIRREHPDAEFMIVGRNPARQVRNLHGEDGVLVVGGVPDVRPYISAAAAVVAPLRLARGIQNKVLEALAMDKPVFASEEVCRTFGDHLPAGIAKCRSVAEFGSRLSDHIAAAATDREGIRDSALRRFRWSVSLSELLQEVERSCAAERTLA